jgi:cell shape-determining protein MreC
MSLRFNQVFVGLLALSFLSAFILPSRLTNPVRSVQGLFYPVARPARAIGGVLNARMSHPPLDNRAVADVKEENAQLRQLVSSFKAQLEELQRINADRNAVGDIRKLCTPVPVDGNDPGTRDSLPIRSGTMQGIKPGMAVLYSRGVVGRIERSGLAGAQVQLCTDKDFRVAAQIRRYQRLDKDKLTYIPVGQTPPLLQGTGRGMMCIRNMQMKETTNEVENPVQVGDVVVLDDVEWELARGMQLGVIEKIQPIHDAPLTADITVRPYLNLGALREVMVLNKVPTDSAQTASGRQ